MMNDNHACAVLLNTVSIQKYIFASNKLKENLGASFLVQDIYESFLQETLEEVFQCGKLDLYAWKTHPEQEVFEQYPDLPFDIGYIGGGNALLFFQEEEQAEKFLKAWTRLLLVKTPGLTTAAACDNKFDLNNFKDSMRSLAEHLQKNQVRYIPQTVLPAHGITGQCRRSGFSMEAWHQPKVKDEPGEYVSSATKAKLGVVDDENSAKKKLLALLGNLVTEKEITDEIDKLGQSPGEDSHIAIVHIDGNSMGKRFKNTETLADRRRLSATVQQATKQALRALIRTIKHQIAHIRKEFHLSRAETGEEILPIRPIIVGGDDITFVTDGRLGIYCAEIFLKAFEEQTVSDGKALNACAGIAITKSKFPFSRGYELSEELCRSAKKRRHDELNEDNKTSWLDFHIAYGGFSGVLKDIRTNHYQQVQDEQHQEQSGLLFRPYLLNNATEEFGFDALVERAKHLKYRADGSANFPNLKIKELRTVLTQGEVATSLFIAEQKYRGRVLPQIQGRSYEHSGFEDGKTPYFDMIEFLECYPDFALKDKTTREVMHENIKA